MKIRKSLAILCGVTTLIAQTLADDLVGDRLSIGNGNVWDGGSALWSGMVGTDNSFGDGSNSIIIGDSNYLAAINDSLVVGYGNAPSYIGSAGIFGEYNSGSIGLSVIIGRYNYLSGDASIVVGTNNSAGSSSSLFGTGLVGENLMIAGTYNVSGTNSLFVVANGADATHRHNALEVSRAGKISLYGTGTTAPSIVLDPATSQITVGGQVLLAPNSSGNVGVGTINPQYTLDVNGVIGNSSGDLTLQGKSSGGNINIIGGDSGTEGDRGGDIVIHAGTGDDAADEGKVYIDGGNAGTGETTLLFQTGLANAAAFAGDLGVGTTSPAFNLDVNGTIGNSNGDLNLTAGDLSNPNRDGYNVNIKAEDSQYQLANGGNISLIAGNGAGNGSDSDGSGGSVTIQSGSNSYYPGSIILNALGGNVGIGTASPAAQLDVIGATRITGTLSLFSETSAATPSIVLDPVTSRITVGGQVLLAPNSSGNIGIGTSSPTSKLQVVGDTILDGSSNQIYSSNKLRIGSSTGQYSGAGLIEFASPANTDFTINYTRSGQARWSQIFAAQTMEWKNNAGKTVFFADNAGNVGIGTTSPTATLSVVGTGYFSSSLNTVGMLNLGNTGSNQGYIRLFNSATSGLANIYNDTANGGLHIDTATNSWPIQIDGSKLILGMTGSVGIGTTTPAAKLDVNGGLSAAGGQFTVTTAGDLRFGSGTNAVLSVNTNTSGVGRSLFISAGNPTGTNQSGGTLRLQSGSSTGNAGSKIEFYTSNTTSSGTAVNAGILQMVVAENGNVGIGTSTPAAKLDITGATKITGSVSLFSGTSATIVLDPANSQIRVGGQPLVTSVSTGAQNFTAPSFSFNSDSTTNRMTIDSAGNVGIGTATPAANLHVSKSQNGQTMARIENSNTGNAAQALLIVTSNGGGGGLYSQGSAFTSTPIFQASGMTVYSAANASAGLTLATGHSTAPIRFVTGGYPGSEKMRIDSAGNVGIGTSSSNSPLSIVGGSSTQTLGSLGGNLQMSDFQWTGNVNERAVILSGANGTNGYGSWALASNNAEAAGQVLGYLLFGQTVSGKTGSVPGIKGAISMVTTGTGGSVGGFGADMTFTTRANNAGIYSEGMRITSTGNVGIGTTAPAAKLDVNGTTKITGTVSLFSGTNATIVLDPANSQIRVNNQPLLTAISTGTQSFSAPSYSFNSGSTSRLTIQNATGNVGIGTSSPSAKLTISGGDVSLDSGQFLRTANGDNGVTGLQLSGNENSEYIALWTADAIRLYIDGEGNLGIGTSTPTNKLTVAAATTYQTEPLATATIGKSIVDWRYEQGWTGGVDHGITYYIKLADVAWNNGSVQIEGLIGGHTPGQGKATVNLLVSLRDTPIQVGSVMGQLGDSCDIQVFKTGSDETSVSSVYLVTHDWAEANLRIIGISDHATLYPNPTRSTTAPSGTLLYTLSQNAQYMWGNGNTGIGTGISSGSGQVVVGKYNDTRTADVVTSGTDTITVDHTQGVFVVGSGTATAATARANALRVLEDGTVLVKNSGDIDMGEFHNGPRP